MFTVSDRVKRLAGSERSQRPLAIPKGAVRLDMGEPDFPTPEHIQEAACKAMRDNRTHYGNAYGEPALREAVCMSLRRDYGVERTPENVLITAGASAPEDVVQECVEYLERNYGATMEQAHIREENVHFPLPKSLRELLPAGAHSSESSGVDD